MRAIFQTIVLFFLSTYVYAVTKKSSGFGEVAKNLMDPVNLFSSFVNSACFLVGGSFLVASVIKYVEHRRSPLMVPISTVVFLLIAGTVLILLPFASLFLEQ